MKYTHIMLHHTASKDCPQGKDWEAIKADHLARGWRDIGYNFGVEFVDGEPTIQTGRPLGVPGAHCPDNNMNRLAIGIAVVGNFELGPPSPLLIDRLASLCGRISRDHQIPIEHIVGHRDFKSTLCPGKYFPMQYVRDLINSLT